MRWKWVAGIAVGAIVIFFAVIYLVASTYDYNKFKPYIKDLAHELTGRELIINGDIELKISLLPTLIVKKVTFQNAAWGEQPEMVKVGSLEVQLAIFPLLAGRIELDRLILLEPEILIEISKSGKSNLEFDVPAQVPGETEVTEPPEKTSLPFTFREIAIRNGTLHFADHRSGQTHLLQLEYLSIEAPAVGQPAALNLEAVYNGTPFQASGKFGQLGGILIQARKWPLDLNIHVAGTDLKIDGTIQDLLDARGFDLNITAQGHDLGSLHSIIGKPMPVRGPFKVSGHFVARDLNRLTLNDLALRLGKSTLTGSAMVDLTSGRPAINGQFKSPMLDLRPMMGENRVGEVTPDKKTAEADRVFSDSTFDLAGLQAVNLSMDLQVEQLLCRRFAMDDLKTKVVLTNGYLLIKTLTGSMGGGKLKGCLYLGSKGALDLDVQVERLDLGRMVRELQVSETVEGVLDLDVNLHGRGHSVASLMAGLNGDVVAVLYRGRMPLEYIKLVSADISSTLLKLLNPFQEKITSVPVNCAVVDFNIQKGVARSDVIVVDDARTTLVSYGQVDLKTEKLEFRIETRPKEGLGTDKTGKISVSLSEITRPFKLTGTLASPSISLDVTRTIKTVGTALLGPVGIAYLLVSDSSDTANTCVKALETAGRGTPGKDTTSKNKMKRDSSKKYGQCGR